MDFREAHLVQSLFIPCSLLIMHTHNAHQPHIQTLTDTQYTHHILHPGTKIHIDTHHIPYQRHICTHTHHIHVHAHTNTHHTHRHRYTHRNIYIHTNTSDTHL